MQVKIPMFSNITDSLKFHGLANYLRGIYGGICSTRNTIVMSVDRCKYRRGRRNRVSRRGNTFNLIILPFVKVLSGYLVVCCHYIVTAQYPMHLDDELVQTCSYTYSC